MAINLESEGASIAIIQNKNKSMKDKKLYITSDETNVKNGFTNYEFNEDETLQSVPNNKAERTCAYIYGQSGSGKSFFTTQYLKEYKKLYPKRDIFVISSIEEDKSIDSLKPKRINVLNPDFLDDDISSEILKTYWLFLMMLMYSEQKLEKKLWQL